MHVSAILLSLLAFSVAVAESSTHPLLINGCEPLHMPQCLATDRLFDLLANKKLFWGVVTVAKAGRVVFNKGYGQASVELGVAMDPKFRFPIASNTKFFVAVALYQLQARGLLSINDDVSKFVLPQDVGLQEPWCPRLHGDDAGPCQQLTIRHLLGMSSGIIPAFNALDDKGASIKQDDWRYPFLWKNREYKLGDWDQLVHGTSSIAEQLKHSGLFKAPLMFVPGVKYDYSNFNFIIASYIVETVANTTLQDYISAYITRPLGLNQTVYDPMDGLDGALHNYLAGNSYWKTSPESSKIYAAQWRDSEDNVAASGGSGGMISTTTDMIDWFLGLVATPQYLGLNQSTIYEQLLKPYVVSNLGPPNCTDNICPTYFAQGMYVTPTAATPPTYPSPVSYVGGIAGYDTSMAMWPNPSNRAASDVAAVFANLHPSVGPFWKSINEHLIKSWSLGQWSASTLPRLNEIGKDSKQEASDHTGFAPVASAIALGAFVMAVGAVSYRMLKHRGATNPYFSASTDNIVTGMDMPFE